MVADEHPYLRNFGPPRVHDLTQTTPQPPIRRSALRIASGSSHTAKDREEKQNSYDLANHEKPQDIIAEAMNAPYYGVKMSEEGGHFLVWNSLACPSQSQGPRQTEGTLVGVAEGERKRKKQGTKAAERFVH